MSYLKPPQITFQINFHIFYEMISSESNELLNINELFNTVDYLKINLTKKDYEKSVYDAFYSVL